jgi:1,2-phenylacetyl-CoA epoxidase PaaB subunit
MTDTGTAPYAVGGTDGPAADALLRTGRFFTRRETSVDLRAVYREAVEKATSSTGAGGATTRSSVPRTG